MTPDSLPFVEPFPTPDAPPILLVEDDDNDIVLIRRAIDRAGLKVRLCVARDPIDAVHYLQGHGKFADRAEYPVPMLMLLDIKLPRGSGFDVLRWVRERSGIKRLPVVVLTSSNADRDINMAYELGANSYIVKPLTFESLLQVARTVEMYWLMLNQAPDLSA